MATTSDADESSRPPVEDARDELRDAVPRAAATLTDLLDAEDERIRLRAAETILDRAGLSKSKQVSAHSAKRDVGGATKNGPLDDLL